MDLPYLPDIGPVEVRAHPEYGPLANVAGILQMCQTSGTERGRAVCREFCKAWDALKDSPEPEKAKQFKALEVAFAAVDVTFKVASAQPAEFSARYDDTDESSRH